MIGTFLPVNQSREVSVVGAGIAGLLLAYRLDKLGYQVTLYEAADRVGGLISTQRTEYGIAEAAAHSFLATPAVRELCQELRVELVGVRRRGRARYVWRGGKPRRMPLSIGEALAAFGRAYFKVARKDFDPERQTMAEWALRHVGPAALEYGLSPFLRGIYGAEPEEIGVRAAFPGLQIQAGHSFLSARLAKARIRPRPPKRAKGPMMAPLGGMAVLTGALERELRQRLGERFRLREKLTTLPAGAGAGATANIALCVPAPVAAQLLKAADPGLASALGRVRYAPLVCVTAFVSRKLMRRPIEGVGVLMPRKEARGCLGILFNSSAFPERAEHEGEIASFTVMLGGTQDAEVLKISDNALRDRVAHELREVFGCVDDPLSLTIARWPAAVPVYSPDLPPIWEQARRSWCATPGHILFGNYTGQVSLRGMIESVSELSIPFTKRPLVGPELSLP